MVTAADYGLAVVKLQGGAGRDFKPLAEAALAAAPSGPSVPRLLYVLPGIAVEEQDWPAALARAKRLVAQYPSHETADDALERVGAGAARAQAWPVAYEAYALLRGQYPTSPFVAGSAVAFAESAAGAAPDIQIPPPSPLGTRFRTLVCAKVSAL